MTFPDEPSIRSVRALLRDSSQHQQQLLDRNPEADGYALWCSLFLMRLGDTHFRLGDDLQASRTYRRALRVFPVDAPVTHENESDQEDWNELRTALPILLDRFASVLEFVSLESADEAHSIGDYVERGSKIDWLNVQLALDSLLESASL